MGALHRQKINSFTYKNPLTLWPNVIKLRISCT